MQKIFKDTKEIMKEFHFTNLVWLLERKIREHRSNWNDCVAEYCEVHQNGHIIKTITYPANIRLQIEKERKPLDKEEQQKIDNFKHLIKTAWGFGFFMELKDLNDYIRTGKVKLY